jgi:hypothetical protein
MAIHGVLIQRNENVQFIAEAKNRLVTGSESQEDMAAANDRLVGIVRIEVQAAADKYPAKISPGVAMP